MSARLEFSCARPLHGVEVRLFGDGAFSAGITAVEISGELADSSKGFKSLSLSELPDPRVKQSVRKGRNLYEGYQRGIGLAFSNLGARIAVDPDFYRARALAGSRTIIGEASLANIFLLLKFFLPRLAVGHIVEFGPTRGAQPFSWLRWPRDFCLASK